MYRNTDLNSIHQDVLNCPIPDLTTDRERLVNEVLERAKSAFKLKSYKDAELLYTRAITINPIKNYYSNRCITRIKMDKLLDAEQDADKVISLDNEWCKGYFRKAQVYELLKEFQNAINYYLKSSNKSSDDNFKLSIQVKIRQIRDRMEMEPINSQINKSNDLSENHRLTQDRKSNKNNKVVEDIVYDNGSSSDDEINMRGYRIKKDGSKTTFFNHEQTELEKKLIGDIKPKLL